MAVTAPVRTRSRAQRTLRQLHLWIGAWGAIAAIGFGFTGFLQNHRALLKIPQGEETELDRVEVTVPEAARATPEALGAWLKDAQRFVITNQRVQPGRSFVLDGRKIHSPARWSFTGGNARTSTQAEYNQGDASLTLRTVRESPLAAMSRLHKSTGTGVAWILLSDSFAWSLVALGITGLTLWARGRTPRQWMFSGVAAALVAVLAIGGMQLI